VEKNIMKEQDQTLLKIERPNSDTVEFKQKAPEITALRSKTRQRNQLAREQLARDNFDAERVVLENGVVLSQLRQRPFKKIAQGS